MTFEEAMQALYKYIKGIHERGESIKPRPVGVWFDEQGRIVVKWNNLHNDYVESLDEAAEIIRKFLWNEGVLVVFGVNDRIVKYTVI